ncbi:ABC transporter ATP-binding protein [Nocardia cerradoensis]|uniref:Bicarbonate transport ATP-binding protein CmpD n=1 Tax=Nocardia cerradoensis TaxID=85688 RepID=A0A231HG90_9NOCA|nr:ABC transporter ATP-binding protein [Nocardia cerradoensis]NKY43818.1 ABC transporter ATP-binding protein [Nocardia cerradoensis]OXR47848.1 Bicarbonate transport ATP-binding protein CmpD [Nocardia cerradoensis]
MSITAINGVSVEIHGLGISFGAADIVSDIDLTVAEGEFVCLLGPSGCGKSTLLSSMAGFVEPTAGDIYCDGTAVKGSNAHAGMVFQSSEALFEWMTVRQNVSYGPRMRGANKAEQTRIAAEYLAMVGLPHSGDKYPSQLSGGMRQRVQIARVLANQPSLVLMDEPFGALDAQTRQVLQVELDKIWRHTGCTVVFVTHDIDEALTLADRVVVMSAGPRARIKSIYQVDAPRPRDRAHPDVIDLYEQLRDDIRAEVVASLRNQGIEEDEL